MKKSLFSLILLCFACFGVAKAQTELMTENFDGMSSIATSYSATGWFAYNAGNGNNWTINTSSTYAHSGSNSAQVQYNSSYAANCYLVSAPFTTSPNMTEISVSLYERSRSSYYAETFEVFFVKASDVTTAASVTSATQYNAISSQDYTNETYAEVTGSYTSSALAGQDLRVVVHCTSIADRYYLNIDDITVSDNGVISCPKPANLEVTNDGATATATWEGDATDYNISINGNVINNVTSPYTFEVETSTTYTVMVEANCTGETSGYCNPVTFTVQCLPQDMCSITLVLNDSYGDGWGSGAKMEVVDAKTSVVYGSYTLSSGSTTTYELALCPNTVVNFNYTAPSSYAYENGWTIYDPAGEVINEHTAGSNAAAASGIQATYTMECSGCFKPSNLTATNVTKNSATLSWTENGEATAWNISVNGTVTQNVTNPYNLTGLTPETSYTVKVSPVCEEEIWSNEITFTTEVACPALNMTVSNVTNSSATIAWNGDGQVELEYAIIPEAKDPYSNEGWYYYDNGTNASGIGLNGNPFSFGVMFPAGTFEGDFLSAVRIYDYAQMEGTLTIYNDGTNAPSNQVYTTNISLTGTSAFVDFDVNTKIDLSKNVWVIVGFVSGADYAAGTCEDVAGDPNGRWVEISGDWYDLANAGVSGQAFMIRAHFETSFDPTTLSWIAVDDATSPYELTDLQAATRYAARVRAYCGEEDGYSEWTMVSFQTLSNCAAPTNLTATNILDESATLNWNGVQESYNVRYNESVFFEGFEDGIPSTWTTIDADGDGNNWFAFSELGTLYPAHEGAEASSFVYHGNNAAMSASAYNNPDGNSYTALSSDQYLITPQLDLGGTLKFYVKTIGNYGDSFSVLLSTRGTEVESFTTTLQAMAAATPSWTEVSIELSSYAGQQGYIAIRHQFNDGFFIVVDDFGIYDDNWTEVNNISGVVGDNTLALTSLNPEVNYTWQVQGINEGCEGGVTEWSEMASFTTSKPLPSFTLEIDGYIGDKDNYYLIASPVGAVTANAVEGLRTPNFDFYSFNQASEKEWINHRDEENYELQSGVGYLYANNTGTDLVFHGNPTTEETVTVTLTYAAEADGLDFPDWNLVGNPFEVTAYPNQPFYAMEGGAFVPKDANAELPAMNGAFVVGSADVASVTFTKVPANKASKLALNLTESGKLVDRAIVSFGKGQQLPKFQLFKNSTKVYIEQDNKDYAIVNAEEIGEMPVSFKAEKNGNYTISFSNENVEFGYLHLIDNMTGADIDLLETPSYSFDAKVTDYASRFKLVFAAGSNNDDSFACYYNGNIVINNEGSAIVNIIDVLGRTISSQNINGSENVSINAKAGVYTIQLIQGENVKTQKIVVE